MLRRRGWRARELDSLVLDREQRSQIVVVDHSGRAVTPVRVILLLSADENYKALTQQARLLIKFRRRRAIRGSLMGCMGPCVYRVDSDIRILTKDFTGSVDSVLMIEFGDVKSTA